MFKDNESRPIETVQDPNTGETIHRVAVSPNLVKSINEVMVKQNQRMQEFVMNSQNYFAIQTRQLALFKDIDSGDKAIKEKMQETMKKAKLDMRKAWQWNLQLNSFEYRTPPIVPGMSEAEIKASKNPGQKPDIVNNPSIAVK